MRRSPSRTPRWLAPIALVGLVVLPACWMDDDPTGPSSSDPDSGREPTAFVAPGEPVTCTADLAAGSLVCASPARAGDGDDVDDGGDASRTREPLDAPDDGGMPDRDARRAGDPRDLGARGGHVRDGNVRGRADGSRSAGGPAGAAASSGTTGPATGIVAAADDEPGGAITLGGQEENVWLRSTDVDYDSETEVFSAEATVQNLIGQALGTRDGATVDGEGVRVFYQTDPVATGGTGTITILDTDGEGMFTGSEQPFYEYAQTLEPGDTSDARTWTWSVPETVTTFEFTVYVHAAIEHPDGWVDASEESLVLEHGESYDLEAAVRDVLGDTLSGAAVEWTSADDAVATVNAGGRATGVAAGATTILASVAGDGDGEGGEGGTGGGTATGDTVAVTVSAPGGSLVFVDASASGADDGTSWHDAHTDLGEALAEAAAGNEIRVAEGTYVPTERTDEDDPQSATFKLKTGVEIYGGYPAGGGTASDRDPSLRETILSGDLAGDDGGEPVYDNPSRQENAYHVVDGEGTDATAVLDGFTITGGNAIGGTNSHRNGGGLILDYEFDSESSGGSPTLANLTIRENSAERNGAGLFNDDAEMDLADAVFSDNRADGSGGGMHAAGGPATLTDVVFEGNAAGGSGGGVVVGESSIRNTLIRDNVAGSDGGGILIDNVPEPATLVNVTMANNTAGDEGGGLWVSAFIAGGARIRNAIAWGNAADVEGDQLFAECASCDELSVANTLLEGGMAAIGGGGGVDDGGGNLDADPLFADADAGNLRLLAGSPAIDTGDDDSVPADVTTDLAGHDRIFDGDDDGTATVDMGAYESGDAGDEALTFTTRPPASTAGESFDVEVALANELGEVATDFTGDVTLALADNPSEAALSGTLTVAAEAGVANFTGLSLDRAATGYSLEASADGHAPVESDGFDVGPTHVEVASQPTDIEAGQPIAPAIEVTVHDAVGVATAFSGTVVLSLADDPTGAELVGDTLATADAGAASFDDVTVRAGTGYTIEAGAATYPEAATDTSAAFDASLADVIEPAFGDGSGLTFAEGLTLGMQVGHPSELSLNGESFTIEAWVKLDAITGDQTVVGSNSLFLNPGPNDVLHLVVRDGVPHMDFYQNELAGTATLDRNRWTHLAFRYTASTGEMAIFVNGELDASGTGHDALTATDVVYLGRWNDSSESERLLGALDDVRFWSTPLDQETIQARMDAPVDAEHPDFNALTAYLPMDEGTGDGSADATVSGFDVSLDEDVHGWTVRAGTFDVGPVPESVVVDGVIEPAVEATMFDLFGELDDAFTETVTIALADDPGGATLSGSLEATPVDGVATFPDLSIDEPGDGYALEATAGGGVSGTTRAFDVVPAELRFTTQPDAAIVDAHIDPAPEVRAYDPLADTLLTSFSATIAVAFGDNPGAGTLSGTLEVAANGGIATFPDLSVDRTGDGYTLQAISDRATAATSDAFDIVLPELRFDTEPTDAVSEQTISPALEVGVYTPADTLVVGYTNEVTLTPTDGRSANNFEGDTTATPVDGVATFPDITVVTAGTGYELTASADGASSTATQFTVDLSSTATQLEGGGVLTLDGDGDYVEVNTIATDVGATDFTVEAWVRPEATSGNQAIFAFNDADGGNRNMLFYQPGDSTFAYYDEDLSYISSADQFEPGVWHHVAVTIDWTDDGALYVDGQAQATFTTAQRGDPFGTFSIGQEFDGADASDFLQGEVDDLRIWDRALDQATIQAWKDIPVDSGHPEFNHLEAYFPFNEGSGGTAFDVAGAHEGTLHGDAGWGTR